MFVISMPFLALYLILSKSNFSSKQKYIENLLREGVGAVTWLTVKEIEIQQQRKRPIDHSTRDITS